ncbi:hypothetical protein [uncultured Methylibium sp.]|uniref:hypothetical protein n=1 Tax=uncultured Methylibium sp. TaxID=381093 RepID=UPI0025E43FF6|nr:hypothetical protein [uncultured Methylibium sp.]
MPLRPIAFFAVLLLAGACSPTLDWREVRPAGAGVSAMFPCKPERQERPISLAGATVSLQMLVCSAGGVTWGLGTAEVSDPARVAAALAALRASRLDNLGGRELEVQALALAGMTPNPQAVRLRIAGRRPDGSEILEQAWLFARGTRVFHVAALGGAPSDEALGAFFGGLKLNP